MCRIIDLDDTDYGEYKCVAENPLGTDQQTMTLFSETTFLYFFALYVTINFVRS